MSHSVMIVMYIIFGVGILTMLIGILRMLDWYAIFSHFYGNNPEKAKVYVDFGENEEFYEGEFLTLDEDYYYFRYKVNKSYHSVMRPVNYKDVFVRGRLKVLVDYGSEFAKPLCVDDVSVLNGLKISSLQLDALLKPKLAIDMLNAISSRKGIGLGFIMTVLLVAVIALGVIYYMHTHQSKPMIPISNNVTNNITGGQPANNGTLIIVPSGAK